MTDDWRDDVFVVMLWCVAAAWVCLFVFGCVTRTTVCLETAHGLGRPEPAYGHRDSVGGSVCAELERP